MILTIEVPDELKKEFQRLALDMHERQFSSAGRIMTISDESGKPEIFCRLIAVKVGTLP